MAHGWILRLRAMVDHAGMGQFDGAVQTVRCGEPAPAGRRPPPMNARTSPAFLVLAGIVLATTACSGGASPSPAATPAATPTAATTAAPSTVPTAVPTAAPPTAAPTAVPTAPAATPRPGREAALTELETNLATWERRQPANYQFTWRMGCFCPPEATGPFTVTVRDGEVTITPAQAGGPKPGALVRPTIADLFATARALLASADTVAVIYDPTFGFPSRIDADPITNAVDDEASFSVTDFLVLP